MSSKIVLPPVEKILASSTDKDMRIILKELLYDRLKLVESIFPMARIVLTEALLHEDVREAIYQNIILKATVIFNDFYTQMINKGLMRSDVKPEVISRCLMGNIGVFIAQRKLFGDKFEFEDLEKEFDQIIDVVMYGISSAPRET
jgi:ethanolamine utilization protein EutA (predicted chaperonin)